MQYFRKAADNAEAVVPRSGKRLFILVNQSVMTGMKALHLIVFLNELLRSKGASSTDPVAEKGFIRFWCLKCVSRGRLES